MGSEHASHCLPHAGPFLQHEGDLEHTAPRGQLGPRQRDIPFSTSDHLQPFLALARKLHGDRKPSKMIKCSGFILFFLLHKIRVSKSSSD